MQNRPALSLAPTAWPRSGGDRRNSACFDFHGPDSPQPIWKIPLDDAPPDRGYFASGSIVAADGCLRVVHRGVLRSVSPDGRVLWKRSLRFRDVNLSGYSLPLAVSDPSVLFTCNGRLLRERGGRVAMVARGKLGDDSETSPNLGYDGSIYCGGFERASRWHQGQVTILDEGGYDIHAPAVYADGSVALASYRGTGLCRKATDGSLIFQIQTQSREHGLVTLNDRDEAGCQSLDDRHSLVVDGRGNLLWTWEQPATFSCYPTPQSGWLALSDSSLTRLSSSGQLLWTREVRSGRGMGQPQAVVDNWGFIYAPSAEGIVAFDPHGVVQFSTAFEPGETSALCPLASGEMAVVHNACLYLIGKQ